MHVAEARKTLGTEIPWLCDSMSNETKHALGDAPNSEFLLGPDGKVIQRRAWSDPEALRKDLERLVGAVRNRTKISDLEPEIEPAPESAPTGVVPGVKVPGRMQGLRIEPKESDEPFYVKLRAEADQGFFNSHKGTLYLGFHVDPIYRAHWNNLVEPPSFEIETPQGVTLSATSGQGPKVKEESDSDPREFLLDLSTTGPNPGPLVLTLRYHACTDKFCKALTQCYTIHLEADPDAGRNRERSMSGGGSGSSSGRPGGGMPGGGGRPGFDPGKMFDRFDKNGDGKLSKSEMPERGRRRFDRIDSDGDGFVTKEEFANGRPGGRSSGGRGGGR